MNVNFFMAKDYEKQPCRGLPKTKPIYGKPGLWFVIPVETGIQTF
jgi:hypothetical protein